MKNRLQNTLKNNQGFTLIELMVVIVVILILASIAIPSFTKLVEEATDTAIIAEGRTVYTIATYDIELFKMKGATDAQIKTIYDKNTAASSVTIDGGTYSRTTVMNSLVEEAGIKSTNTPEFTISDGSITNMEYRDMDFPEAFE